MAEGTMQRGASPQNELSLNMKLIAQHELDGFGGIGEGMGMHKTKDGRRIMWLGHEGPPKNFTAVDVTDPKKPRVVCQTDLPHSKMRSNSIEVVGDLMIVSHQIRGVEPPFKPAGTPRAYRSWCSPSTSSSSTRASWHGRRRRESS